MQDSFEKVFSSGESVSFEIETKSHDNKSSWLAIRMGPIRIDKQIIAVALFATNVTPQKQAEKQREDLREQLARAEKLKSLGLLAGGVAHDLNNVIMPLVAYPDLILLNIPADSPAVEQVKRMGRSAEDAAAIIQDLLVMARRGRYKMAKTNLNKVISSYLDSPGFLKLSEDNPDVKCSKNLDSDLPDIWGSTTHLSKVIMNLVINAYDAIPGGGDLIVSTKLVNEDKTVEGNIKVGRAEYIALSVRDGGVGIEQKNIEKIFDPYYSSKDMGRSGTGLGLSIVYGILKDHKGHYEVLSKPGEGTEFIFYFPIMSSSEESNESTRIDDENSITELMGTESVLVVDDFDEHRKLSSELLSSLGYNVKQVSNGHEAIKYVKRNKVDVIVLVMVLEKNFDALDTYREITKIAQKQKAVIISGYSPDERVEKLHKLGIASFVKKPFSRQALAGAVRQELDREKSKILV